MRLLAFLIAILMSASSAAGEPFRSVHFNVNIKAVPLDSAGRLPPDDWVPTFSDKPIGERLPFNWSQPYREVYKQDFEPVTFYNNAIALCNFAKKRPDMHDAAAKLYGELIRYTATYLDEDSGGLWVRNGFDFVQHGETIPAPWYGGIMNAFVATGMLLAEDCFKDPEYSRTIKGLIGAFHVFHEEGEVPPQRWFSYIDANGYLWFDEYPKPGGVASRVLNGNIFGLFALAVYADRYKDKAARALVDANLTTLKQNIMLFRRPGQINSYDLYKPSHPDYGPNRTIRQQCQLWRLTGDHIFRGMAYVFMQDIIDSGFEVPDWAASLCN